MRTILTLAAALAFLAATAAADPFLDAAGPPVTSGSATSVFDGDLDDLTGTLTLDDMIVVALQHKDGSTENTSTASPDDIMEANVYLNLTFDNGALDTSASDNLLKIFDSSTTFFEGTVLRADLDLVTVGSTFEMLFVTGSTETDPTIDEGDSKWMEDQFDPMMEHGLAFIFGTHVNDPADGRDGENGLNNAFGKLTPNPEPGTLALFGLAAVGGLLLRRRRRRS